MQPQQQQRKSTSPGLLLLGFLSVVMGSELGQDDYPPSVSDLAGFDNKLTVRLLQEVCQEFPDVSPCNYLNSFESEEEEPNEHSRRKRTISDIGHYQNTSQENNPRQIEKRAVEATSLPEDMSTLRLFQLYADLDLSPEKRFRLRSRNPDIEGYKRGPGFRSWGGKRARFVSWGGKRGNVKGNRFSNWGGKRSKFASWGGKRSGNNNQKVNRFSNWGGKRGKFTSWGGKRAEDFKDVEKRAKFGSWGGKRAEDEQYASWDGKDPDELEKKSKFASWGGKRVEDEIEDLQELEKRAKFRSWGGKRDNILGELSKRSKFASWGGKRVNEDLEEAEKRSKFASWGGKRVGENDWEEDKDEVEPGNTFEVRSNELPSDWSNNVIEKRPQFQSWGGKRATFKSWGGKRMFPYRSGGSQFYIRRGDFRKLLNWGGKRKFSSWGGKRSYNDDTKPSYNISDKVEQESEEYQPDLAEQNVDVAKVNNLNSYNPIVNKRAFFTESQNSASDFNSPAVITVPLRTSEFIPQKENQELIFNLR